MALADFTELFKYPLCASNQGVFGDLISLVEANTRKSCYHLTNSHVVRKATEHNSPERLFE
jgi:hypothetical protein